MCGLFAIINHYKRQLDKRAFITLGCANDARGGDACGIMIDRKIEKVLIRKINTFSVGILNQNFCKAPISAMLP